MKKTFFTLGLLLCSTVTFAQTKTAEDTPKLTSSESRTPQTSKPGVSIQDPVLGNSSSKKDTLIVNKSTQVVQPNEPKLTSKGIVGTKK